MDLLSFSFVILFCTSNTSAKTPKKLGLAKPSGQNWFYHNRYLIYGCVVDESPCTNELFVLGSAYIICLDISPHLSNHLCMLIYLEFTRINEFFQVFHHSHFIWSRYCIIPNDLLYVLSQFLIIFNQN